MNCWTVSSSGTLVTLADYNKGTGIKNQSQRKETKGLIGHFTFLQEITLLLRPVLQTMV
jgi:hypothetical protein